MIAASASPIPSSIALYRRVGGRPFGAAGFDLVNLLVPHLKRAFQIAVQLGGIQRERLALVEVLDRLPFGIVLLDEQRKVVLTTAVKRIGDMVISLVQPTGDDDPLVRENRPKLMEHLAGPLLFGKTSALFGAAKGKLISDMLCRYRQRNSTTRPERRV